MRRHRIFLAAAALVLLVGWLAWSVLLTESEMPQPPPPAEQAG